MKILDSEDSVLRDEKGKSLSSKVYRGEISWCEYQNEWAKRKGFKDRNEYRNEMNHKSGNCLPFDENKDCSSYLGVHIAERLLPHLFENEVQKMPNNNKGYDFICKNGYKIDVKSSCLHDNNSWDFHIKNNVVADYFLMIAVDSRESLNVEHIWLMKGDEVIRVKYRMKLNERVSFTVMNSNISLERYKKYEMTDKMNDVKKICDEFKDKNLNGDIND